MPATGFEETAPTEKHEPTGTDNVDALLSGSQYSAETGTENFLVSFSFPTADSSFSIDELRGYEPDNAEPFSDLTGVSAATQAHFRSIASEIARFTNLDLEEVADEGELAGTIRLAWTSFSEEEDGETIAWAYLPGNHYVGGDIWLLTGGSKEDDADFRHTIVHELGHALGLKHPFQAENGFPALDSSLEGVDYTVMSYTVSARHPEATWADLWPTGYMSLDIKALQALYGVDTITTGGADTYDFSMLGRHYLTIWDAGGNDTLSVSNGDKDVHLSLVPGSWSNVGTSIEFHDGSTFFTDEYSVFIADDTILETAIGAGGDDTLEGNDAANKLRGNAGNDTLTGGKGNDILTGHAGDDVQLAGAGDDQIWAGPGDLGGDTMVGGAGNDKIGGGAGSDLIVGGGFDEGSVKHLSSQSGNASDDGVDSLFGADGNDTVLAGGWDDGAVADNGRYDAGEERVSGTDDNVLWSGNGNDLVYGAAGADKIGARDGSDTVHAGDGNDTVFGGASNHSDIINGEGGNDTLFSGAGNDEVSGGAGNDTIYDGSGDDSYAGGSGVDTFIFSSAGGTDSISDFNIGSDILNLAETVASFTAVKDVEAVASTQGNGVLLDLGGGNSLHLLGVSEGDLVSMNFEFEA